MGTLVLGAATPALADDRPFAVKPGLTSRPDGMSAPVAGGPVQAARLKAKSTGKPVTIDELTTGNSQTVAEPDGRLTLTTHLQSARVKKNGKWIPVDAGLAKNADGTWSPKATPSGVSLSGGGTGPLATLSDPQGRSLALTFPVKLPAPQISGDGARYPEVLPGVDLQVRVTDQGAVREVLVVKDARAAADPALRSLRLATTAKGLTTTADPAGNLTAKTADGTVVFSAPTPLMWDSAAAPAAAPPKGGRSAAAAPTAGDTGSASSTEGPGQGAQVRPIAVAADADALTLTPDASLLGGAGTAWPLYIDPSFTPTAPMGTNHYAQVMEGCPNTPQYDTPQPNGEGVGYQHYQTSCHGMERSYYEFNTSAVNAGMVIDDAKMYFTETYGANHDCKNATAPVALKWTGAVGGGTDWNHQPQVLQDIDGQWVNSAYCEWKPVTFTVTNALRSVAQQGITAWTVALFGDETRSDANLGFMRFRTNPYLIATYDLPPNTPDSMYTSPDSQNPNGAACGGGNPGWIGRTTLAGDASNITLHAWASTPMPGTNLQVAFHVWDNMTEDGNGNPGGGGWPTSQTIGSAGWGHANIGFQVGDGHQYGWNAAATDGLLNSSGSAYCYFDVDLSPPSLAEFGTSPAFPPLGSGITPTAHAGDQGATIRVSSNDPTPGGCSRGQCIKSGVRGFQYSLDDNIPPVGANTVAVEPDGNGTATADIPINLNPDQWGTHRLYVRAVDGAGNTQPQAAVYDFYAPWNPATKVVPGDLTFDGTPDFLSTSPDGSLTLVPGNSDFTAAPGLASTADQSPEHDSWNNYLVAHRGSLTQSSVDDLFAYNKGSHNLYAYFNDSTATPAGTPGHFSIHSRVSQLQDAASGCAGGIDGTWNNIAQLISPGAVSNPAPSASVITVENGHLRYYRGTLKAGCRLAQGADLGDGDWSGVTLIAPGTAAGTPTLWARDNTTGAISTFPLAFDGSGAPSTVLHAPVHHPLVSAVKDTAGAGMCADIDHGRTDNGTTALLWNCAAASGNQLFTQGTDGALHVVGKCLDVPGGGTDNGTMVQLYECNDTDAQKWTAGPYPGTLQNPRSGRCLAVPRGDNTPGTGLIIWDCLDDASQRWEGPAAQAVLPLGLGTGAYPSVDSPGDVNGDGNPDLFVIDADGRLTEIPGAASSDGIPRFAAPIALGTANRPVSYNLHSAHDQNKCMDSYGAAAGNDVVVWDCWNGTSQKFTFAADGTLRAGGRCVSTRDNATWNGARVGILECVGDPGQSWVLRDGSLYNPASNRCLELPGWQTANGTVLGIWDCTGNPNQRWSLGVNTA
ncbi:ricin-type beta-trefoil lectin domain protein [Kitasatospora sp. NPDC049258]|uniref:ricin-type beta-trefoil lectin domain protein n=1 Tax=Kitasatospora sp. NPDC049258 TaxID=3155394 RepID=UPI0034135C98